MKAYYRVHDCYDQANGCTNISAPETTTASDTFVSQPYSASFFFFQDDQENKQTRCMLRESEKEGGERSSKAPKKQKKT
jgi:hypothetical protein